MHTYSFHFFYKLFKHLSLWLTLIHLQHTGQKTRNPSRSLKVWKKKKNPTLNVNTIFNLINLYTLHASPALETTQKRNKYNLSPWPFCLFFFPEGHECFKQERLFSYLHRTKRATWGWTFKKTYEWKIHHHQAQLKIKWYKWKILQPSCYMEN